MHVPRKSICTMPEEAGEAGKRHRRREWVRRERGRSNMMRRTDFKQLPGGRRIIAYGDDAARRMAACGVLARAAAACAPAILHNGIARHGRSTASIMTDRGSLLLASGAEGNRRGEAAFEAEPKGLGMRHAMARIAHLQTNGKIERVHREI